MPVLPQTNREQLPVGAEFSGPYPCFRDGCTLFNAHLDGTEQCTLLAVREVRDLIDAVGIVDLLAGSVHWAFSRLSRFSDLATPMAVIPTRTCLRSMAALLKVKVSLSFLPPSTVNPSLDSYSTVRQTRGR